MRWIEDAIHPKPRGRITRIALMLIGRAHGLPQLLEFFLRKLFAFPLQLLHLDFHERPGGRVAAHHRITRRRPRKNKARAVRFAAHRLVARAEAAPEDHANLRHDPVRRRFKIVVIDTQITLKQMLRDCIGIRVNRAKKSGMVNITSSVNSRERSGINTILHELNPLFTINVTMRDIKSKNVYSRVNSKATTQWRKTESANGVHLEGVASDNRSS